MLVSGESRPVMTGLYRHVATHELTIATVLNLVGYPGQEYTVDEKQHLITTTQYDVPTMIHAATLLIKLRQVIPRPYCYNCLTCSFSPMQDNWDTLLTMIRGNTGLRLLKLAGSTVQDEYNCERTYTISFGGLLAPCATKELAEADPFRPMVIIFLESDFTDELMSHMGANWRTTVTVAETGLH